MPEIYKYNESEKAIANDLGKHCYDQILKYFEGMTEKQYMLGQDPTLAHMTTIAVCMLLGETVNKYAPDNVKEEIKQLMEPMRGKIFGDMDKRIAASDKYKSMTSDEMQTTIEGLLKQIFGDDVKVIGVFKDTDDNPPNSG